MQWKIHNKGKTTNKMQNSFILIPTILFENSLFSCVYIICVCVYCVYLLEVGID